MSGSTSDLRASLAPCQVPGNLCDPGLPLALRPVRSVDVNVIVGEVAGPKDCRGLALVKIEPQGELFAVELGPSGGIVEAGVESSAAQEQLVDADVHLRGIEARARIARGANYPSPIGVRAGDSRLDQRRVGNSPRHSVGIRRIRRPRHFN